MILNIHGSSSNGGGAGIYCWNRYKAVEQPIDTSLTNCELWDIKYSSTSTTLHYAIQYISLLIKQQKVVEIFLILI